MGVSQLIEEETESTGRGHVGANTGGINKDSKENTGRGHVGATQDAQTSIANRENSK